MTLPKNNLPKDSQPWGRAIEAQLAAQAATIKNLSVNLSATNLQTFNANLNQSYANPTIYSNSSQFDILPTDPISGVLTQFSFKINSKGFLLDLGCLASSNTLSSTDATYLYAELYNSDGNNTGLLDASMFAKTTINNLAYFPANLRLFVPAPAGQYSLKLYYATLVSGNVTVKYKNIYAVIQPIPNTQ